MTTFEMKSSGLKAIKSQRLLNFKDRKIENRHRERMVDRKWDIRKGRQIERKI